MSNSNIRVGTRFSDGNVSFTVKGAVPGKPEMWFVQQMIPGFGFRRTGNPKIIEMSTQKILDISGESIADNTIKGMLTLGGPAKRLRPDRQSLKLRQII